MDKNRITKYPCIKEYRGNVLNCTGQLPCGWFKGTLLEVGENDDFEVGEYREDWTCEFEDVELM